LGATIVGASRSASIHSAPTTTLLLAAQHPQATMARSAEATK